MSSYFIYTNSQQTGPFTLDEIKESQKSGLLSDADLIWAEGMPDWIPLKNLSISKKQFPWKAVAVIGGSISIVVLALFGWAFFSIIGEVLEERAAEKPIMADAEMKRWLNASGEIDDNKIVGPSDGYKMAKIGELGFQKNLKDFDFKDSQRKWLNAIFLRGQEDGKKFTKSELQDFSKTDNYTYHAVMSLADSYCLANALEWIKSTPPFEDDANFRNVAGQAYLTGFVLAFYERANGIKDPSVK